MEFKTLFLLAAAVLLQAGSALSGKMGKQDDGELLLHLLA